MVPYRLFTALQLRAQGDKALLTVRAWPLRRIEAGVDHPDIGHLLADDLLGGLDRVQPTINIPGEAGKLLMSRPPFCASRFRWREVRTSWRASAMRKPGGCSGALVVVENAARGRAVGQHELLQGLRGWGHGCVRLWPVVHQQRNIAGARRVRGGAGRRGLPD